LRRLFALESRSTSQKHCSGTAGSDGEARDLERFLINKLDQRADTVARIITEVAHTGSSFLERLEHTPDEITIAP
jgi:hypothetical protein